MRRWQWLVALFALLTRRRRRSQAGEDEEADAERIVPEGLPERRAENLVVVLLGIAALLALGFVVTYALFSPEKLPNELLGVFLGGCLLFIGFALAVVARRLVVTEELEEDYPEAHPDQQSEIVEIVHESGSRFTRKRLLIGAGTAAGGALGLAAITPALSLGPVWDTDPLDKSNWHNGVRVVDDKARPMLAGDIEQRTFYTGFPENADPEDISSPIVIIRLDPAKLKLPAGRADWAPNGILAFSKICTHAGCAIGLYRKPTFPLLEPNNALVCPCHYSTFNPYTGGTVIYGPAGRPLPQLPLMIDDFGYLRAAGTFSQRVGPSWWNVRENPTT